MLARLDAIEGVVSAEVDHRGELLRISVISSVTRDRAVQALRDLGYGADPLTPAPDVARWYGRADVRELSREEAHVIARRVVTSFAQGRSLEASVAASLADATARGLYGYFEANPIADPTAARGARREAVSIAVEMATRNVIGEDSARALAAALCADLDAAGTSEQAPDP